VNSGLQAVSDLDFDRVVGHSAVPVLVEFWKPECGHCRALLKELKLVQQAAGARVLILTMNVEENHQIPAELQIASLPVLALYRDGEFSNFIGGVGKRDEIVQRIGLELCG
jgi:thioredoxin-like negative regulator of GroEL